MTDNKPGTAVNSATAADPAAAANKVEDRSSLPPASFTPTANTTPADETPEAPAAQAAETPAVDVAADPAPLTAPEPAPTASAAMGVPIGRIPVTKVSPVIEGGAYAAKATLDEELVIKATVFREGHDSVMASVVLTDPDGHERRTHMQVVEPAGWDRWAARVRLDREGAWTFRVEAWDDPWSTFVHHAEVKLPAGMDVPLLCLEAKALFAEAREAASAAGDWLAVHYLDRLLPNLEHPSDTNELRRQLLHHDTRSVMALFGPRRLVSPTPDYPLFCDRKRALFSAWYEFFPRSQGAQQHEDGSWTSGSFDSSHERLEAAAAMGFDVVYLPPIHPIGQQFRKGPNNTLTPGPNDPGSPWAIGGPEGGHDALHPELGDFAAFDRFVARARQLGLEVAMDFALQASPDHPWVREHPEWFSERADGTIAYAENPPKKYQDIYPINFDRDRHGIYHECLRLLHFWMDKGVRIFRVDNPHTKPVEFWAWLLGEVRKTDPDVIFLAEAFTKPEMMHMLGKIGFQQSYTYFTWRNEKWEIGEYLAELTDGMEPFYRPNFFVNTPDINPRFLQTSGPAGFTIRAVLASTLSPSWGVYSGYELFEHTPFKPGGEEYLDSEKYQYRPRDWSGGNQGNLNQLLTILNQVRNREPALQQLRNIHFHHVPNSQVLAYSKTDRDSIVIVVCSLDPHHVQESEVYLDLTALGLEAGSVLSLHDELTGADFRWGAKNFVRLTPADPAHLLTIRTS